ncbi:hypothetical protein FACS189496_2770 [Bacilli bacterium]|nr:hypothetical protein FACS189496_2770 [Bacilli bacterium]
MSVIVNTNLVYLLQPFNNSNLKRIVKRSKIYFMDTGLACYLSYVNNSNSLERSNLSGAFFETYVVGQIIRSYANNGKNYKTRFY